MVYTERETEETEESFCLLSMAGQISKNVIEAFAFRTSVAAMHSGLLLMPDLILQAC